MEYHHSLEYHFALWKWEQFNRNRLISLCNMISIIVNRKREESEYLLKYEVKAKLVKWSPSFQEELVPIDILIKKTDTFKTIQDDHKFHFTGEQNNY